MDKLTVIASESYKAFAKGLQKETAETLKDRPQKAEVEYFVSKLVTNEQGDEIRLTEDDAKHTFKLIVGEIIDEDYKITPKGKELIEQGKVLS